MHRHEAGIRNELAVRLHVNEASGCIAVALHASGPAFVQQRSDTMCYREMLCEGISPPSLNRHSGHAPAASRWECAAPFKHISSGVIRSHHNPCCSCYIYGCISVNEWICTSSWNASVLFCLRSCEQRNRDNGKPDAALICRQAWHERGRFCSI